MDAQPMSPAQLATAAEHLMAAKMFSLASCVMLFYDIAITFGDEVEKIWKQRFTGATVLWFLNRYLSPLGYIVIIVSFHDPSWSKATCQRYVLYPEVLKIFTATAVGIIFILRLYSIYSKSNVVLYGFSALLLLELGIKIWAFTDGTMLQLPPGFVGCILTGRSSPGDRIIYTWVAELVFDSVVFFATLYRTIQLYRRTLIGEALSLITVIMRDGIMYFAAIFVSNLVTVLIFVFATPDLKVINASFSTLITSLMVSRLMLNLRAEVLRRGPVMRGSSGGRYGGVHGSESYQLTTAGDVSGKTFQSSLIGNLGAPIITFEHAGYEDEYESDDRYDDGASGIHRQESSSSDGNARFGSREQDRGLNAGSGGGSSGSLAKKPSLTASLGPVPGLPKLMGKRRPRTAEDRTPGEYPDNPAHTRSLPGQVVVQVTEEIVVDDVPDTAARRTPVPMPMPGTPVPAPCGTPPHSPHSPHSRTHPRSPSLSLSSPTTPPGPWTRPSYPTRPPHSAGAEYPPSTPHAPDSPFAVELESELHTSPDSLPAHGQRPSRSARSTQAARRSWAPPPSWRLSLDRDRDSARRPAGGS